MAAAATARDATMLAREELERYTDAIVHGCLDFAPGDVLFVQGRPAHRELMVALADAGYRAGARLVDLDYVEPRAQAARVRHAKEEYLGPVSDWKKKELRAHLEATSATVTIIGESDPDVFDGLPPERVAEDSVRPLRQLGWYIRRAEAGQRRWTGVAWPTAFWASQVYPDLPAADARRRLAEDILWFCRLGPDDPPGAEGWTRHVEDVARRAERLTDLGLERLELRGPGTDLRLRLSDGTAWLGGRETNAHGRVVTPNFPTEECFTSPDAAATEGTFRCTRPLSFRGRMIEGIAGEFRGGRLVRLDAAADDDREFVAAFIKSTKNAERLGEVALVDRGSRIGEAKRIYWNTLIDENAVAHIAFGMGFRQTRTAEAGARSVRELNRANLHLDVMIGDEDLEATGYRADGSRVALIRDGSWQI